MNNSELAIIVAKKVGVSPKDATAMLTALSETVTSTVKEGHEVTISGLGKFTTKHTAARQGRNPATGLVIDIAASTKPAFRAGKRFSDAIKA